MFDEQRLEQHIKDCREQWDRLSEHIRALRKQKDLETRFEEEIRLESRLSDKEKERQAVEAKLGELEAELAELKKQKEKTSLIQEARRLERNQAYPEAIQTLEKISEIDPDDSKIANEIQRLKNKQQQLQHIDDYIKQLTSKLPELKTTLFGQIITTLRRPEDISDAALGLIDIFVTGMLSAKDFTEAWHALSANSSSPRSLSDLLGKR